MKRPHRRTHFVLWLLLAPATALAGFVFWTLRPDAPHAELPPGVEAAADMSEND